MSALKVSFTPTNGDLVGVGYVGLRARPFIFWTSVAFFVFLPWTVALLSIVALGGSRSFGWTSILTLVVLPPIAVASFAFLPAFMFRGARTLRGAHTYEFSSSGINLSGPGFQSRLEWAALDSCVSSNIAILFMSGKVALLSVPGRALDESSKSELLALAKSNSLLLNQVL